MLKSTRNIIALVATLLLLAAGSARAQSYNEVLGIVPDVLVPWANADSPFQRAAKARAALEKTVKLRNTLVAGRVVDPNAHSHDRYSGRPNP